MPELKFGTEFHPLSRGLGDVVCAQRNAGDATAARERHNRANFAAPRVAGRDWAGLVHGAHAARAEEASEAVLPREQRALGERTGDGGTAHTDHRGAHPAAVATGARALRWFTSFVSQYWFGESGIQPAMIAQ